MEEKKNLLTYAGLKKLEEELHDLKVVKRKEVAEKIKEAREQGDLSENAEYDAEANSLEGKISNESPVGKALIGAHTGDVVEVEMPAGIMKYKVLEIQRNV